MQALLLVDIQNDFLPGGALPTVDGEAVVPAANALIDAAQAAGRPIAATQDWHPPDHLSFASQHDGRSVGDVIELDGLQQILWPDHCVQHTPGAAFAPGLNTAAFDAVFPKGTDRRIDSYSGFFDNGHRQRTGLDAWLKRRGVDALTVAGLAADVCVKFTVLDARELGYDVTLKVDACRGVEHEPGDCDRAIAEMRRAGARIQ